MAAGAAEWARRMGGHAPAGRQSRLDEKQLNTLRFTSGLNQNVEMHHEEYVEEYVVQDTLA